jgi:hypothetical protein
LQVSSRKLARKKKETPPVLVIAGPGSHIHRSKIIKAASDVLVDAVQVTGMVYIKCRWGLGTWVVSLM